MEQLKTECAPQTLKFPAWNYCGLYCDEWRASRWLRVPN